MIYDCFTDAAGNLFLHGQEVPEVRAIGFQHRMPCPHYEIAAVNIGKPYGCDCGGTVLMGWRDWWPFPDEPHVPAVVIDMSHPLDNGHAETPEDPDENGSTPTGGQS